MTNVRMMVFLGSLLLLLAVASCAAQPDAADRPATTALPTSAATDTPPSEEAPADDPMTEAVAQQNTTPTPAPPQTTAAIYATYCAACHGAAGEGAPAGVALNTATLRERAPSEVFDLIRSGVPGTAMAGWGRVLEPDQIEAVAAYVQTWQEPAVTADPPPTATPPDPTDPQAVQVAGAQLYTTFCASCHGENGSGGLGPVLNSQQFLSRFDDATIRDAILYGGWWPDSPMPAYGAHMSRAEVETLVNYIRAWEPDAPSVPDFRGDARADREPGSGGSQGQGQGQGRGQGQGQQRGAPVEYTGEVIAVERSLLRIQTEAGEEIGVLLGPPWYWQDTGIALTPGDQVQLETFTPGQQMSSAFYLGLNWLENLDTGERYVLHNPDGTPAFRP